MQQCKYFAKGFCSRGTSCHYSHDNPPTPIALPTSLADRVGAKHSGPSHTATTSPDPRPSSMLTSTDSTALTAKDWRSETTCRYYLQGICMKGEACPFAHPSESIGRDRTAISTNVTLPAKDRRSEIPCRYFLQGTCSKGHACSFAHTPVQSAKNAGPLEVGVEDLSNCSREIFGAIALFGVGAQVSKVSLSSDFSAVRINGLDNDTTADLVVTILAQMGFVVPVDCVRMSGNHGGPHTSADVRIEHPAFARNICSKLPGNEAVLVKHPRLQAMQLPTNILSESTAHRVDCRNVSCSWHKPSVLAWLNFSSEGITKRVCKRFNSGSYKVCGKKVVCDQPVHSDIITHRLARGHNEAAWSIRLKDLPPTVTKKDIRRSLVEGWSEPNHIEVGEPPSNDAINGEASALIKDKLSEFGPIEAWEISLESSEKRVKATARFQHDADAREAARCLNNKTIDRLDVGKIAVQVVNSVKFKLTTNIYDAVKPEIDSVCQTWVKNFVKCKVYRNTDPAQRCTVIRIFGEDAKGIAKAKASVEVILAGTVAMTSGSVPMWSPFFNTGAATRKFKEIYQDLNVLIVRDTKRLRLRLYGTCNNYQKALQTLESIIKSDSSKVHILELDQETFRNALNGGFQDIVSVLGKDFAAIDIISTPKRIIVTGSSDDYQTALKILNGPRSGTPDRATLEHECVVCWTEDEASIRTKCNHIYCSECFENTCSTAGSGNREFSIHCHGDSGACQTTFSLSELQEHLSSTAFEDTLKLSFMSYIRRRPHIFRFCPTPDCEQVYRADGVDKLYTCPQCIMSLCTSCHISHENLTCSEYKDLASGGQEAFERLKKERGFKDCPKCKTTMEKTEGCNHMVCSGCRIHICWVCLATFEESDHCYQHMNKKHGGIGLDNLIPDDELNMFPRLPGIRAFRRF